MKIFILVVMLLMTISGSFAGNDAQKKLVAEFVKASKAEQAISAEIEASLKQYSMNATPEQKAQLRQYFDQSIGWDVIKDQYADILGRTYTSEELKASLAFVKTPVGQSIANKNIEFTQKISALMAKNMLEIGQKMGQAQIPAQDDDATQAGTEMVTSNVEEHVADGKTYFTGMIENQGKKIHRGVQVEVNLFKAGKFVDQYSTYIAGNVVPGMQRYFKISCGCKDAPPAPHDTYRIQVLDGY